MSFYDMVICLCCWSPWCWNGCTSNREYNL